MFSSVGHYSKKSSFKNQPLSNEHIQKFFLSTMEVNPENGFVKYSKLAEENVLEETMDNQNKTATGNNIHLANAKIEDSGLEFKKKFQGNQDKFGTKALIGLSLSFLMIVTGLVAGLFILDSKNQTLANNLSRSQHQIVQNENLLHSLIENMTDALNISKPEEVGSLMQGIQTLITQNQRLIKDFEARENQTSSNDLVKLHQNDSLEQELNKRLVENLKLQNPIRTKDEILLVALKDRYVQFYFHFRHF